MKKILYIFCFTISLIGNAQIKEYAKTAAIVVENLNEKAFSKTAREGKSDYINSIKSAKDLNSLAQELSKLVENLNKKAKEKHFEKLKFEVSSFGELGELLFEIESSIKLSAFPENWDDTKQEWKTKIIALAELELMKQEEVALDTVAIISEMRFALKSAQSKFKSGAKKISLNKSSSNYYKEVEEEKMLTFFYEAGNFKENAFKLLTQLLNAADKIKPKGYRKTDFIGDSNYFEVSSYNFEFQGENFAETAKRAVITIGVQEVDGKFRVIVSFSAPII